MRTFMTFALALFLSMLAAQVVAQQLAIYFRTREEFVLVMVVLGAFACVSIAILTVAFVGWGTPQAIDVAALIAATSMLVPVLGFNLYAMAMDEWTLPAAYDAQVSIEILLPALMIVLIQWWFVRRCRHETLD